MTELLRRKKAHQVKRVKSELEGWAIVRVSKENLTQDGSPDQQLATIKSWEKRQKKSTGKTYKIVNYIIEDGVSGRYQNTSKRKDILELLDLVNTGAIDFVVAERLNRISRDEVLNLQLMRAARENNVELHEINYGKFNPMDRGQRMGWKFRNIEAGEYSEGVSEDVARKLRQAMVHNGKDPTPCPVIGLDLHPRFVGHYVPNREELKIWEDIAQKFIELGFSRKGTLDYCKAKGYKTKTWWTKGKNKNGEIIPPKKMGDKDFNWNSLLRLLGSARIRGYNYFYDNWNMFSDLQDSEGWVRWEYRHYREHGNLVAPELIAQVDKGLEKTTSRVRSNQFLLSGILFAPDGSKYYGETAKSGGHLYYYNRSQRKRFPIDHVHKLVLTRLGELLEKGNFENLAQRIFQQASPFLVKRQKILSDIDRLNDTLEGFSTALRENVAEKKENLVEIIGVMMQEKEAATKEIEKLKKELAALDQEEDRFNEVRKGIQFKQVVKLVLSKMKTSTTLAQKKFIQAVIPKIVVQKDEKGFYLQVFYNLDISPQDLSGPSKRRPSIPEHLYNSKNVISLFDHLKAKGQSSHLERIGHKKPGRDGPSPAGGLEVKFWPLIQNGRGDWIRTNDP